MTEMKYAVVFEEAANNYAAFLPDVPGCVATGAPHEEVARNIRAALALHLEGMRLEGLPIPQPAAWTELVEAQV